MLLNEENSRYGVSEQQRFNKLVHLAFRPYKPALKAGSLDAIIVSPKLGNQHGAFLKSLYKTINGVILRGKRHGYWGFVLLLEVFTLFTG